jgi:hypothetical protein
MGAIGPWQQFVVKRKKVAVADGLLPQTPEATLSNSTDISMPGAGLHTQAAMKGEGRERTVPMPKRRVPIPESFPRRLGSLAKVRRTTESFGSSAYFC